MTDDASTFVDLDLVDKVVDLIPEHTWDLVRNHFIDQLVDVMPSTILQKLTDDPVGFDKAEAILHDYYRTHSKEDLIADAFKILGAEHSLYLLDSWQLDKQLETGDLCSSDSASMSTMQGEQTQNN